MKIHRHLLAATLLAGSALVGGSACAYPFTLNFEGTVSQAQFDPFDPLGGAVVPGSPLWTYLNFDTAAVDAAPSPDLGSYTLVGGTYGVAAVVQSVVFPLLQSVNISVVNGTAGGPDQYSVFAWQGIGGGLGDYFTMSILLQDDQGTALDSDMLPVTLPDLGRFAMRTFNLTGQYTDYDGNFIQYEVMGEITPGAAVPEPTASSLVGLALLAGALATRRGGLRSRPAPRA